MRKIFTGSVLAGWMVLLGVCSLTAAQAQSRPDAKTVYIVTHIDVTPNFADGAKQAIQNYAAESRKEKGAISIEGLVQDGRTNHFTIVEIWQNRAAFEAHSGQPHVRQFRETLQPMLGAPFDERLHEPIP